MTDVTHRRGAPSPQTWQVPRAGHRATPRDRSRSRRKSRRRSAAKIAAITTSALVLLAAAGGAVLYGQLTGNIKGGPLIGGGSEKPDAFGRTPINVLMMGSDGRNNAADCRIGGDCGPGANADVEMLVHVSADRSNATVMSIPRDTVAD